ncbi:MAG: NAD-dependent epimerase/dehydratase family protein [Chthoniobacteraceae bacterium]
MTNLQRTVLITGVAGFLGRYLAREFASAGWEVVGLDDAPPENAPSDLSYHRMRLPDSRFDELLATANPDVCVHAAGRASVALSMEDPAADFRDGVVLAFALLDAIRRRAPGCRFILLSSAAVYGNPSSLPISESHPVAPLSPYGFHKRQCELLIEEFARVYAVPALAVRIFSAYGPGLRRQVVWDIFARTLTKGRLSLHGTGAESRDFIHAADVARGLVLLAEKAPAQGEIYNLATGRETTINELARLLLPILGANLEPEFDGCSTPGDPVNWRADVTPLTNLGFAPAVSLEDGLRGVAAWCAAELKPAQSP